MRIGLATSINVEPDLSVIAEASTGEQGLEQYRRYKPDLVLMDLRLPGMGGDEVTARLCKEFPEAKVVMLSKCDSPVDISRCAEMGARSYVSKALPLEDLLHTIREVAAGRNHLPPAIARRLMERGHGGFGERPPCAPTDGCVP